MININQERLVMSLFPHLFKPIQVGTITLKNRIVLPALGTNFATSKGYVTPRLIEYYKTRAKGGVGLIIVEGTSVRKDGRGFIFQLSISEDGMIPGLKELTSAIKAEGARVIIQLHHGGRNTDSSISGVQPVAPSSVRSPVGKETPRALSKGEIATLIETFAQCAFRAKEAGFDGVELHGAHEYLISQFLSPYSNFRQDEYGGSPEGRWRFAIEIVEEIRKRTGPDFLISFRISADEYVPQGLKLEETIPIAKALVKAGVDVINVSGGVYETPHLIIPPMPFKQGVHLHLSKAMKAAISVPVIGVGRILTPEFANEAIEKELVDLVAIGRGLVADPNWPIKAMEGRTDEICPCVGCNQGCIDFLMQGRPITCLINPEVGKEKEFAVPSGKSKKVFVIGAGPGGLEATRRLAKRGHKVTLYEKNEELGGQLRLAAMPPAKEELFKALRYLTNEVKRLGVEIKKGKEITSDDIIKAQPEVVIIATGSKPINSGLAGLDQANVVSVEKVLENKINLGSKVVILGGGNTGCEVADYIAEDDREVIVIEMGKKVASDVGPARRYLLMRRLREKRVKFMVNCRIKGIQGDKVLFIREEKDGSRTLRQIDGVDNFINCLGNRSLDCIAVDLEGQVKELILIGDALSPGKLLDAIAEGAKAAISVG